MSTTKQERGFSRNIVAKHMRTFNRAKVEMSKKRYRRQDKTWQKEAY